MKKRYDVEGMTCAACKAHVEDAAKKVKGVKSVNVNLLNNNMDVELTEDYSDGDLENAISKAGYSASISSKDNTLNKSTKKREEKTNPLRDLIIAFVILILLMYVSMGNMMLDFPLPDIISMDKNKMGFALIQFILVLPICYIYRRYFINGFKMLFKGAPNMDSLIAIGATASLIYGIFSLFMISYGYYLNNDTGLEYINDYHKNLYFESAGMILVLVSLGKYLEGLSKRKTTASLEKLMKLAPKDAIKLLDGKEVKVNIEDVNVGDILVIKRGEKIPVDGNVIEGEGSINEANITGESMPKYKKIDDLCYASTILESGYIKIKALKVGHDTSINQIIDLVYEASNSKAPISRLADRVSRVFVPTILLISLITFIVNLILLINLGGNNPVSLALNFAITVVVIACPCALGLATPVAIMVGTGKAAELGIIIRNAEILENTSKLKAIVFDKTGTITEGMPNVTDYIEYVDNLKDILYSIESKSAHPLALAIINYIGESKEKYDVTNLEMIEGRGLLANIENDTYYIGNYNRLIDLKLEDNKLKEDIDKYSNEGKTPLIILKNDKLVGIIALKDRIKDGSVEAISKLNSLGIKTYMLTGDNKITAKSIADEVNISSVIPEVLPVDKGNIILELKKKHGMVAMVGDGVNDAIALANSDIAISVKSASDIAIDTSDIVLLHNNLSDIPDAIRLSKRVLNTIKLCLFWAFFYNFICVILATGFLYYVNGFKITPIYGSIAMSISSVSVVLTALTINFFKPSNQKEVVLDNKALEFKVKGMMCNKCTAHVEEACMRVSGVVEAHASLDDKNVIVKTNGNVNSLDIINNIKEEGYKAKEVK